MRQVPAHYVPGAVTCCATPWNALNAVPGATQPPAAVANAPFTVTARTIATASGR